MDLLHLQSLPTSVQLAPHLDTFNILFHPFALQFSSIPAQNSYHPPQKEAYYENNIPYNNIIIPYHNTHIHTSPCPHSWVTNLKLHHPQGLTLHCGSKHPSSNQDCQHLWWQGISLDPKCSTTRNIQSPKAGAKGQFDKGYLGVWSHLASFSVFWRCNRSPNVWAAQWNNWSIMKSVLSASVSISGLSVSCWPQNPSFIDPWPINLTFSTKHTFIHIFLPQILTHKVVFTEELVHVFPSLRDSSKSDGDAGPEAPEGRGCRWFPAANGNAAWDELRLKTPKKHRVCAKTHGIYGFMDFLVFLFACDKWPWSMIKKRLDMIIRSRLK